MLFCARTSWSDVSVSASPSGSGGNIRCQRWLKRLVNEQLSGRLPRGRTELHIHSIWSTIWMSAGGPYRPSDRLYNGRSEFLRWIVSREYNQRLMGSCCFLGGKQASLSQCGCRYNQSQTPPTDKQPNYSPSDQRYFDNDLARSRLYWWRRLAHPTHVIRCKATDLPRSIH